MKEGRKRLIKDLHSVVGTVWQTSIETEFPKLFKGEDTKIEVDKWYRYKDVENWMVKFTCADKGSIVGYGLNCNSEPMEDWTPSVDCLKGLVLCSEEEAKQSLIKAAKKIGVKVGAKVRCLMNGSVVTVQEMEFSLTEYGAYYLQTASGQQLLPKQLQKNRRKKSWVKQLLINNKLNK